MTPARIAIARRNGRSPCAPGKKRGRRWPCKTPEDAKYMVIPGNVTSQNDGQRHFISGNELLRLYDVSPTECYVLAPHDRAEDARFSKLIRLTPKLDGDYTLPK